MVESRSSLLMNNWLSIKKTMSPSVLIGQIKLNHQDCLLSIILGIGIGKGRGFNQQLASYSPFEPSMPVSYAPYATSAHRYSSWGWSDSWGHTPYFRPYHVEYAGDHHVQGSLMLKVTILSIKIGLLLKIRKRLSSKFTK
jgi:hypothetical protein